MEDIRTGRNTVFRETIVPVTTVSALLVPFNDLRIALLIGSSSAGLLTISQVNPAVTLRGLTRPANNGIPAFDIQSHGRLVFGPFYGVMSVGTDNIVIWETLLSKE